MKFEKTRNCKHFCTFEHIYLQFQQTRESVKLKQSIKVGLYLCYKYFTTLYASMHKSRKLPLKVWILHDTFKKLYMQSYGPTFMFRNTCVEIIISIFSTGKSAHLPCCQHFHRAYLVAIIKFTTILYLNRTILRGIISSTIGQ